MRTVWWDNDAVTLIDQRELPRYETIVYCRSVDEVAAAIRDMAVRGAPAIGVTAAFGMALAAQASAAADAAGIVADLEAAKAQLDAARPTAVNLAWASTRMLDAARAAQGMPVAALREHLVAAAQAVHDEDDAMCRAIGEHGAALLRDGVRVLTHCNAGGLATSGYGTALAPIKTAHRLGRRLHVLVDETRPFLQGARLTSWELLQEGIDQTLITDNMAAYFMRRGEVDCVIVGADRIVANGDVANKIGTYGLAVLAHAHGIPFYVAAPTSTIDLDLPDGSAIPIEQRDPGEVTQLLGQPIAPEGVTAAHPAFDVTPHALVSAIITEHGVTRPPYQDKLHLLVANEQRAPISNEQ